MKNRTVKLYDCQTSSKMEWIFQGSFTDAEKDLRMFVKSQNIKYWFGSISDITGLITIRNNSNEITDNI